MKNRKRLVASLLTCLMIAGVALGAGMVVTKWNSFSATGTPAAGANTTIIGERGYIVNQTLHVDVETNVTLTAYRARDNSSAEAAVSATTNINLYTQGSNSWSGFTPTAAADYILVSNADSGYQLSQIASIVSYTSASNFTTYTLGTAITAAKDDVVYIVDATDNVAIAIKSNNQYNVALPYMFTGKRDQPIYLDIPVTGGNTILSGTYTIRQ